MRLPGDARHRPNTVALTNWLVPGSAAILAASAEVAALSMPARCRRSQEQLSQPLSERFVTA